jgi:hypothetical protein
MIEYTEREFERAGKLLDRLLDRPQPSVRIEGRYAGEEFEADLSIADIETDASRFLLELDILQDVGAGVPALAVGDGSLVPVSLVFFDDGRPYRALGPFGHFAPEPYSFPDRQRLVYSLRARPRPFGGALTLTPAEARRSFSVRAREFLATRLAGLRRRDEDLYGYGLPPQRFAVDRFIGGPVTRVSGCQFSVNTRSAGLTAHWSGIYYISPNYLGAPTTPASGVLQAGTYVFGVSGRKYGASVQWDTNAVCSLPGSASVHLHY